MSAAIEGEIATAASETANGTVDETDKGAVLEPPFTASVLHSAVEGKAVTTDMLVQTLKRIEYQVRKNYADPDRVTVPTVNPLNLVIHQDFRRDVEPIPFHVRFPKVATVFGKPVKVSSYTVPAVFDEDGILTKPAYEVPIYAAQDANGKPWKDDAGNYVVIDPQNGAIRQRMVKKLDVRQRRSWFEVKWLRFKQWIKSIRFDFRIIKRK